MKFRVAGSIISSISFLILAATFYAWRFSYFGLDDFNNLFWVQKQSLTEMLWHNANPFTNFFRPFGMLFYWILWRVFGLNPLPYHLVAWALHTANVILLYLLLRRIVESSYGAALGALLFGFRGNFTDIYWSFGTIFELLACLLTLLALLIYIRKPTFLRLAIIGFIYLLAIKSKEMAITLPAVLLLYDVCMRRPKLDRQRAVFYILLATLGAVYGYMKFQFMGSESRINPYYMDFSVLTLGRGYGWYFDHLYGMHQRWGAWIISSVLILGLFLYKRERGGLFFLGYVFLTLLPVVFLVNHRYEFYWYLPFLGIGGIVAVAVGAFEKLLKARMPPRALEASAVIAFALVAAGHYARERRASAQILEAERILSEQYATVIDEVRSLPQPESGGTVLFGSLPPNFSLETLTSAVQVALRRTDIRAEVVR
jgi:hypothetical protein